MRHKMVIEAERTGANGVQVSEGIDYFERGHPFARVRSHFAWRARDRMLARFLEKFAPSASTRVLDLGVTPDQSLRESNHFEQRYPWPEALTAATIEPVDGLRRRFPNVAFVRIAPGPLPFPDQAFDLVFSSAVIEHVGTREEQVAFVREISRVSRRFMLTTPNRWFPLDFHTLLPLLHWLPQAQHQSLLRVMGKKFWAETSNLNLLAASDFERMSVPKCKLSIEGVSLAGMISNLIVWGEPA